MNKDSIKLPDSLKFYTPQKRVVYGGGGIMPDIFIPIDTAAETKYFIDLFRVNAFNEFVYDYLNLNRENLKRKYPTVDDFMSKYSIDSKFFDDFISYAESKNVKKNEKEINTSKEEIETHLKAIVARGLFDFSAFYQVINSTNPIMKKAIEVIKNDTFEKEKVIYR